MELIHTDEDQEPPACEVVNFLNAQPSLNAQPAIVIREYDLSDPGSRIDCEAFCKVGVRISAQEYQAAYGRATAEALTVYINGRPQ